MAKTRAISKRRYFARPRRRSHSKGMTLPVAVLAGFAPLGVAALEGYQYNGAKGLAKRVTMGMTGYNIEDKKFYPQEMMKVTGPIVLGLLVHKLAGKLGINRALAGAGVPFLRV
jgi:hypothetical protein